MSGTMARERCFCSDPGNAKRVLSKQAFNHSSGRGFSVGAGYVNDSVELLRVAK
jgi:hypothetical protein